MGYSPVIRPDFTGDRNPGHRVLLVAPGLPQPEAMPAGVLSDAAEVRLIEHPRMLTAERLRDWAPDVVVGALIGPAWDGLDLAMALVQAGYAQRLCVLTPALPRHDLVLREMRALCPGLDIALISLPDTR